MKVVAVTATTHLVPTSLPHIPKPQRPIGVVVVRVETDAGITGFGMAPVSYTHLTLPTSDLV